MNETLVLSLLETLAFFFAKKLSLAINISLLQYDETFFFHLQTFFSNQYQFVTVCEWNFSYQYNFLHFTTTISLL